MTAVLAVLIVWAILMYAAFIFAEHRQAHRRADEQRRREDLELSGHQRVGL